MHPAVLAESAELEWPPEQFLLEELQVLVVLASLVAVEALLGPAVLVEPAIVVQHAEPAVPSWLCNQRAYAGLVLIKHYNNLSYYRISLRVL